MNTAVPGDARRRRRLDALDEDVERHRVLGEPLHQQRAPALPRREQREHDGADHQREPAAGRDLERVGREEREVDERERQQRSPSRPTSGQFHSAPHHDEDQDRVDQHRQRHRDAVRAREVVGVPEPDDQQHDRDEQRPVDERHVDLADLRARTCARSAGAGSSPSGSPRASARTRPRSPPATRSTAAHVASTTSGISAHDGASR